MHNLVDGVVCRRLEEGRDEAGEGDVPPHHVVVGGHLQHGTHVHHGHRLVPLAQLVLVIAGGRQVKERRVEELGHQAQRVLAKEVVPHLCWVLLYQLRRDCVAQSPEVSQDVATVAVDGPFHCLGRRVMEGEMDEGRRDG